MALDDGTQKSVKCSTITDFDKVVFSHIQNIVNMTTLAVVTPSYNDAAFLPDCVESVAEAAARAGLTIQHVVADDCSKDRTPIVLDRLRGEHPHLVAHRLPSHAGCSAALNAAISLTTARWLLVLAADDMVQPDAFTEWQAGLREAPDANVIYSDLRQFGRSSGMYRVPPFDSALLRQRSILPGASFLTRALWEAVGGFDESMPSAQDWDLWVRADVVVGLNPHKRPTPLVRYRYHDTERLHNLSARNIEQIRHIVWNRTAANSVLHPNAVAA